MSVSLGKPVIVRPTSLIPLYEDKTVSVFPDLMGNGRHVLVRRPGQAQETEPTSQWGEKIQKYSRQLASQRCYVHPDRRPSRYATMPNIDPYHRYPVCSECGDGSHRAANELFQTYMAMVKRLRADDERKG